MYSRGKGGGEEDPPGPDVLKCARRQENTREDLYRHRQAGDFTNRNIYRLKLREIQLWHSSRSYDQCCGSAWINLIISINEKCSNKNRKFQENFYNCKYFQFIFSTKIAKAPLLLTLEQYFFFRKNIDYRKSFKLDLDPHLKSSWIQIRIEKNCSIRIRKNECESTALLTALLTGG